jgi:hypothetical protein
LASLLWGRWCHECLLRGVILTGVGIDLPDIGVDLSGISWLKAWSWGNNYDLLLSSDSSGGIGVFTLLTLRVCFSILQWYICRDDQDLTIQSLELFSRIVRGDCCVGDLERKAVRR